MIVVSPQISYSHQQRKYQEMKALHVLLNNDQNTRQPLQLFSKLKALKNKDQPIEGIPMVQSDSEEDYHEEQYLRVEKQLEEFKIRKAKEVASIYNTTREPIEDIVFKIKDQLQLEALNIINPAIKNSVERKEKPVKDMGSTLPGSIGKNSTKETPGFDLPSSKSRSKELTIDLRQFTLGQRSQNSSNRQPPFHGPRQESYVSQFTLPNREPASRKIKDRIMNSQKTHK